MEIQLNLNQTLSEFKCNERIGLVNFFETKLLEVAKKRNLSFVKLIRWGVTGFCPESSDLVVQAEFASLEEDTWNSRNSLIQPASTSEKAANKLDFSKGRIGVFVVPTGLGCSIGGFAGDATISACLAADEFDWLLVNPNVVNAGAWQNLAANMLYVEGYALDLFMKGLIGLRPRVCGGAKPGVFPNKIGVILDAGISPELKQRELQVLEAAKLIWGLDIYQVVSTREPLDLKIELSANSASSGTVGNPAVLIEAAIKLKECGAEAIAVLCAFDKPSELCLSNENSYTQGQGPDPIGGLEAVISHIVSMVTNLPCAHAPVFSPEAEVALPINLEVDFRVAPEIASYSFLPSVLKGLSLAPALIPLQELKPNDLMVNNVCTFIGPSDCWGGSAFLNAIEADWINTFEVASNKTAIGLDGKFLQTKLLQKDSSHFSVGNYLELIGYLKANKLGYSIGSLGEVV